MRRHTPARMHARRLFLAKRVKFPPAGEKKRKLGFRQKIVTFVGKNFDAIMIFVTGASGMLGAHLVLDLLRKGEKVRALKRHSSNLSWIQKTFEHHSPEEGKALFGQIDWREGDLLDYQSLSHAMQGCQQVYHTAAIVSFDPADRLTMLKNNTTGTANVVNACLEHKVAKLCHVSSVSALGEEENSPQVDENSPRNPESAHSGYSISKFDSEMEVWRGAAEGLDVVIVNPSIIFGYANWQTGTANMFLTVWNGLRFYTKGITGFVDVRDVSQVMILLMQSGIKNERFVVNSENLSYREIFTEIALRLGKKPPSVFATPFLSGVAWRAEKLRAWLSGKPPLLTRETAEAAHSHREFVSKKTQTALNFEFIPVKESIAHVAGLFLKDMGS